ncbi:sphingomyelin phosphodiesterase [Rhodotorula toruloides]|nr:sphingomyelin phosphodiesterase [Rhodotorula toruloides]
MNCGTMLGRRRAGRPPRTLRLVSMDSPNSFPPAGLRAYASLHSPDIELAELEHPSDVAATKDGALSKPRPFFPSLPVSLIPRQTEHKHHHFSKCDVFVTTLVLAILALVVVAFALSENPAVTFVETAASCTACATALAPLKILAQAGDDAFTGVIVEFCIGSAIADPDVCRGAIGSQAPILAHSLRSLSVHLPGATRLCTNVFGLCPITAVVPHKVDLPPESLAVSSHEFTRRTKLGETGLRRRWEDEAHDGETFQVVQISDVHIDKEYLVGASDDCTKPICCRDYGPSSTGPDVKTPAEQFGNRRCDTPQALMDNLLAAVEQIAPNRSFTVFSGDVIDAAVWDATEERVLNGLHDFSDGLASWGHSANSISETTSAEKPIYPVLGNHDIGPGNAFALDSTINAASATNAQQIYNMSASDWRRWIGDDAVNQVQTNFGCYSVVHPGTNLRIISLNMNYWSEQNYWLYASDWPEWDPNGIITWLASELEAAEKAGQRAWLSRRDIFREQSNYVYQIIQRYRHTIAAQLYGHAHWDEWELGYEDPTKPSSESAIAVALLAGSVTPRSGDPVFRVYDISKTTYEVLDFTVYHADMFAPGYQQGPSWKPFYSARDYNQFLDPPFPPNAALNATYWSLVTDALEQNDSAWDAFEKYDAHGAWGRGCNGNAACRKEQLCILRAMRSEDSCEVIRPGFALNKRDLNSFQDEHACEGPGLGMLLRQVGAEARAAGAKDSLAGPGATRPRTLLSVLHRQAEAAVHRHRLSKKRWWRV